MQEDFEGGSLTTVVPEADAASLVLAPLLDALCCLHERGIVHRVRPRARCGWGLLGCLQRFHLHPPMARKLSASAACPQDIKPANAVFTRAGSIRLIDFSLSLDTTCTAEAPCCQARRSACAACGCCAVLPWLQGSASPHPPHHCISGATLSALDWDAAVHGAGASGRGAARCRAGGQDGLLVCALRGVVWRAWRSAGMACSPACPPAALGRERDWLVLFDAPAPVAHASLRPPTRALGVMAFQLLAGEPPWSHDMPACLARLVQEEPVPLATLRLMGASPAAIEFIGSALEKDPARRPTAAALRAHPWMLQHAGGQASAGAFAA